ncbi:hypothetical protein SAMN04488243_14712 [Thermus arciformis]|uniref:Uncharacterized protein n=1 Tax=Thermus arciformis TaxID=482827 RepID=A0A1G7KL89_9DEIN|nr:hypothetical protein [Thermus arciformis]SDF38028.1 hypothetical protein SAMN04488243_14712 [Thermus arciformis]
MTPKALLLLPFLLLALAARPGEVLVLPFAGLPEGSLEADSPFPLLLPPEAREGVALAVLLVPPHTPPGVYRVCLGGVCKEVAVEARPGLSAHFPEEVLGRELVGRLKNTGNVPLRVHLSPLPQSGVGFPPVALALAPGEEREVALALEGAGEGWFQVDYGEGRLLRRVRVLGEGGVVPYVLRGWAEGAYPGPALSLALEGPLSREAGVAFRGGLGEGEGFRLALALGPYRLALGLPLAAEAGYREEGLEVRAAYPWALEGRFGREEVYAFRLSPEALGLGYAGRGFSAGLSLPFARPEGLSFRLERYGEPHLYARWEGGPYVGFASPPWRGEAGLGPSGPSLLLAFGGGEGGLSYLLEGGYRGSPFLALGLGYGFGGLGLSFRGSLEGGRVGLALGGSFREGPLEARAWLAPGNLAASLAFAEGPYALRLEGRSGGRGLEARLEGAYAFRLPVPEGLTLALGGYEEVPLEGEVRHLGRPVASARVLAGERWVETDEKGRFRLYVPRSRTRVRAEGPPSLLALPAEASWRPEEGFLRLELPPAALLVLACEGPGKGAYVLGPVSLPLDCGGRAVLPPGAYRLLPLGGGEEVRVDLAPEEKREVLLRFLPPAREALEEARPLEVEWPKVLAPGEVGRVVVKGAGEGVRLLGAPLLAREEGEGGLVLLFQTPWEAEGGLPLAVEEGGRRVERLVPVDPRRPLLELTLSPPRARAGEVVEVRLLARFPAHGAEVEVGDRVFPLSPLPGLPPTFTGRVLLTEELLREVREEGPLRYLTLRYRAWQGERGVEGRGRLPLAR